jgi:hypothetical protein
LAGGDFGNLLKESPDFFVSDILYEEIVIAE